MAPPLIIQLITNEVEHDYSAPVKAKASLFNVFFSAACITSVWTQRLKGVPCLQLWFDPALVQQVLGEPAQLVTAWWLCLEHDFFYGEPNKETLFGAVAMVPWATSTTNDSIVKSGQACADHHLWFGHLKFVGHWPAHGSFDDFDVNEARITDQNIDSDSNRPLH